jgi:hypothetical protein
MRDLIDFSIHIAPTDPGREIEFLGSLAATHA